MDITIACHNDVQNHTIQDINELLNIIQEKYDIDLMDLEITHMGFRYYFDSFAELETLLSPNDIIFIENHNAVESDDTDELCKNIFNPNIFDDDMNNDKPDIDGENMDISIFLQDPLGDDNSISDIYQIDCVNPGPTAKGQNELINIANNILSVLQYGTYYADDIPHNISKKQDKAIGRTITYLPNELPIPLTEQDLYRYPSSEYFLTNSDTISALINEYNSTPKTHICALNYASGMNPGGGFLRGRTAQEENIMRSSGLYPCIKSSQLYDTNNADNNNHMYSEHVIFSPKVPVIRDDLNDKWIEPCYVSFITAPAVNTKRALEAGVDEATINITMLNRMDNILSIAVRHKVDTIMLGSWGAGVFGGDINTIASNFLLLLASKYKDAFAKVIFAVTSDEHYKIFDNTIRIYNDM